MTHYGNSTLVIGERIKQEPLPHMFEWIEMEIAKNREE